MEKKTLSSIKYPINIAVFASGTGSNFRVFIEKIESGDLKNARIVAVISNNSKSGALNLAKSRGIPSYHISTYTHPDPEDYEQALFKCLKSRGADMIILAGYMKLLPPSLIQAYPNRIINIHPALLPRFGGNGMYGKNVHEAVIRSGAKESGVTIHYVNAQYDEGPIIARSKVPILPEDTPESLAERVLKAEHDLYWRVVDRLINKPSRSY